MSLRIVQIILSRDQREKIRAFLEDAPYLDQWETPLMEGELMISLLMESWQSEEAMDRLQDYFGSDENFRVNLQEIEASIPRKEAKVEEKPEDEKLEKEPPEKLPDRISRQELYQKISSGAELTRIFMAMVIFAAIVAAVGLMKNNIAVIIGAMVIAPLLGSNVALSLATTLGDSILARRSLITSLTGMGVAFIVSALIGLIFNFDASSNEIANRTIVNLSDIALALATGAAGSLAYTTGISSALVGVMVAVALLPPLVTCGLLFGSGDWRGALGAFLLLLANLICINLAGVLTFAIQGIRPRKWYEAEKAHRSTQNAVIIWIILLALLVIVISFGWGLTSAT